MCKALNCNIPSVSLTVNTGLDSVHALLLQCQDIICSKRITPEFMQTLYHFLIMRYKGMTDLN